MSITDIGVPGHPLSDPPLTEWQAAVRDALNGSDIPVNTRIGTAYAFAPHTPLMSIPNNAATTVTLTLSQQGGGFTLSANALVVPTNGVYLIAAQMAFAANTAGSRALFIRRNGANYLRATGGNSSGGAQPTIFGSLIFRLTAGDLIDLQAFQSSGAALNTDPFTNGVNLQMAYLLP